MASNIKINQEIDKYGSPVVVIVKKDVEYDDWGNEYSSISSNVSTIAVTNDINGNEEFNTDGTFVPGDKVFFFKSTEPNMSSVNTITFLGNEYNMTQIISHRWDNSQQQYEVRGKRI